MVAVRRPALGIVALALVAWPAAAAERDVTLRPPTRRITVRPRPVPPAAATLGVAVAPGVVVQTPFTAVAGAPGLVVRVPHYIGPDGTYDDHADLVKSINGTPCGQECTRHSLQRWGYAPVD